MDNYVMDNKHFTGTMFYQIQQNINVFRLGSQSE